MSKNVAILHYSYPPVTGGVETVIRGQALTLSREGHQVRVITGKGKEDNRQIEIRLIPQISSTHPENLRIRKELGQGEVSPRFYHLERRLYQWVKEALEGQEVCLIHNVMTMPFNLALTAALSRIIAQLNGKIKFYAWCHDAIFLNPSYFKVIFDPEKYPWRLLKQRVNSLGYVTISAFRQRQLAHLLAIAPEVIEVVPNGLDVQDFLGISPAVWRLVRDREILKDDLLMFFPSRILRRKNYELGIKIVKEIGDLGKSCKFLITGPADPHNPDSQNYFQELSDLCRQLGIEKNVLFLQSLKEEYGLKLNFSEVRDFYTLSDLLLITSSDEGFGLPLLEAGVSRIPVVCAESGPFPEIGGSNVLYFEPDESPSSLARRILNFVDSQPTVSFFKRVITGYSWEAVYQNYLKKLIE